MKNVTQLRQVLTLKHSEASASPPEPTSSGISQQDRLLSKAFRISTTGVSKSSRRDFVKYSAAMISAAASTVSFARGDNTVVRGPAKNSARVKSAIFRDKTIVQYPGNGDIFPLTWTRDDRLFGSFSDGYGFALTNTQYHNTCAMWVDHGPTDARFQHIESYPDPLSSQKQGSPAYYGFSVLSIGDRLYQFMCCQEKPSATKGHGWRGTKLIYSDDNGHTWRNRDGSTPVVWTPYTELSRETLLFDEPHGAFSLISALQMGKNYESNEDGFIYCYSINGSVDGLMNQLVMLRVPRAQLLDRSAYEYFKEVTADGGATWTKNIQERGIVHTFPRGWVNVPRADESVVQAWLPSVIYNSALNLYMMACSGLGCPSDGDWFTNSKASYLGLWIAPSPWGPWNQVLENTAWTPGYDAAARCYSPQIPSKWISPDGRSFWLVWSDYQRCDKAEFRRVEAAAEKIEDAEARDKFTVENYLRCTAHYTFNIQRVDLVIEETTQGSGLPSTT